MRSFAAALALFATGIEARYMFGSCADQIIEGQAEFDQSRYLGRWYEIARDSDFFDENMNCACDDVVENFNNSVTIARNAFSLDLAWEQDTVRSILSSNGRGEYIVYDAEDQPDREADTDLFVLSTDYDRWAIEYVCKDFVPGVFYYDSVSIKARTQQLEQKTLDLILLVISNTFDNYDYDQLHFIDQCRICPFRDIAAIEATQ